MLMKESEERNQKLNRRLDGLELKLDFMNRRKNVEVEIVSHQKNKDIAVIRKKLTLLAK